MARASDAKSRELTTEQSEAQSTELAPVIGLAGLTCIAVSSIIGSSIFIVPATIAREVPGSAAIAFAWLVGGLYSLAGALTFAEMSAMLPRAGGPYTYLREAYGELPGFIFSWSDFWVMKAGAIAALAAGFSIYFAQVFHNPKWIDERIWKVGIAGISIVTSAIVTIRATSATSLIQSVGALLKVLMLCALIIVPFVAPSTIRLQNLLPIWPAIPAKSLISHGLAALVPIIWTLSGWEQIGHVGEEIKEPGYNIPRALTRGLFVVLFLYIAVSLSFQIVLPMHLLAGSDAVAADFCRAVFGTTGAILISIFAATSCLLILQTAVFFGSRSSFAAARDGLFPSMLSRLHPHFRTPAYSTIALSAWALLLLIASVIPAMVPIDSRTRLLPESIIVSWNALGTTPLYEILLVFALFGILAFNSFTVACVFALRRRYPNRPRPYRVFLYPFTPLIYLTGTLLLLGNMVLRTPLQAAIAVVIFASGAPMYCFHCWKRSRSGSSLRSEAEFEKEHL